MTPPSAPARSSAGGRTALTIAAGAVLSWLIGALPWVLTGPRLPISPAWPSVTPDTGPWVALPFGEYQAQALVTAGVLGGVVAMAAALALHSPAWSGAVGAALGLGVALTQTLVTTHRLLDASAEAQLLWGALGLAGVLASLAGPLIGWRLRTRSITAALGAGTLVCLVQGWVLDLLVGEEVTTRPMPWLSWYSEWSSSILLAGALLGMGWRTTGAAVRWGVVLGTVWMGTALLTAASYAVTYARSGRASSPELAELADATTDVFVAALLSADRGRGHLIGALLAALMVATVESRRRLSRRTDQHPAL